MLHFDHHCKWLNNCIGKKNYKSYSYLIGSFEILNLIISISGACTISGIVKKNIFYDNLHTNFHWTVILENAYLSMLILMEILALLIVIINGQLIGFHIFLGFKRLTTYQYILSKRAKTNSKICQSPPSESQKTYGNILTTECHSNFRRGTSLRREGEDEHLKFLKDLSDYNNTPRSLTGKI